MPRPKIRRQDLPGYDFWRLGAFKSYSTDLLFDFEVINRMQTERFSDFMPDDFRRKIEGEIRSLHKAASGLKLMNEVRVYLLTDFNVVRLVLYNLEDCIVDALDGLYIVDERDHNDELGVSPAYVVTLFVFKGKSLEFSYDLPISTAMELLIAFQKENLIYAGAFRDTWYGKPRQRDRTKKRLQEKLGRK